MQSALPRTITDSTPSAHCWVSACGLFSAPPALFNRGCPPEYRTFGPSLLEVATSPLHLLDAARRFFIPGLLTFRRLSAVPPLLKRPNRTPPLLTDDDALPISVPHIAVRQYFLAIHVLHQDVIAVIADRMAGIALMIAHLCSSSVCCCYL